ncbi:hypothetical protein MBLNU230_g4856t1 [Neophaeotheca triangularis]
MPPEHVVNMLGNIESLSRSTQIPQSGSDNKKGAAPARDYIDAFPNANAIAADDIAASLLGISKAIGGTEADLAGIGSMFQSGVEMSVADTFKNHRNEHVVEVDEDGGFMDAPTLVLEQKALVGLDDGGSIVICASGAEEGSMSSPHSEELMLSAGAVDDVVVPTDADQNSVSVQYDDKSVRSAGSHIAVDYAVGHFPTKTDAGSGSDFAPWVGSSAGRVQTVQCGPAKVFEKADLASTSHPNLLDLCSDMGVEAGREERTVGWVNDTAPLGKHEVSEADWKLLVARDPLAAELDEIF